MFIYNKVNVLKLRTPVSDKIAYANSVDPDQTVPEGHPNSYPYMFLSYNVNEYKTDECLLSSASTE